MFNIVDSMIDDGSKEFIEKLSFNNIYEEITKELNCKEGKDNRIYFNDNFSFNLSQREVVVIFLYDVMKVPSKKIAEIFMTTSTRIMQIRRLAFTRIGRQIIRSTVDKNSRNKK